MFEKTIDDAPFSKIPAEHPVIALPEIRKALISSRRHPETIYVADKRSIAIVGDLLVELYGIRGQRIPVLYDCDSPEPFTIRWGL